ncbi:arylamine N-acetyltransferase family protein [Catalinimonas niigatensis]|uniref:arylamine N-acetyltransferase family protein n=1 Tax=Catalinimonas niigatensis TaxID=1397264 RepID=UPI002665C314|nr:arylamine N-acetyltransferase [Catalinimonas niigatensis]WPP51022.1 arylamine N-acetyltransferase [Catalinimonas niigatensis]
MNLEAYLKRLNYKGATSASPDTLYKLHRAHVTSVPFENLDIHYKQWIELDSEKFYTKVVEQRRGGFCYELNGLLYEALQELGFQVYFISCSVYIQPLQKFGPYFAHVAIVVEDGKDQWLVDVGFGSSFPEPLKMEFGVIQKQDGVTYTLRKMNDTEISLDRSFDEGGTFEPMYKFTLVPRQLEDFQEMCAFHQTSEASPLYQKKLCSVATPNGRITLTSNHLIITKDGQRNEVEIKDEQDFQDKLFTYFAFDLPLQSKG